MVTSAASEAVRLHLFGTTAADESGAPIRYTSGFLACLRDARLATGRDEDSGEVRKAARLHNGLGAVGYIVLLDQIGKCFRPDDAAVITRTNAIEKALAYWAPEVDEPSRRVIYALRNALAHDYSLFNEHPNGDHRYDALFTLDRADRLVSPPTREWDLDYANRDPAVRTKVSVVALGRLAEMVVERIRTAFNEGHLEIQLGGGIEELTNRYGMSVPNEPTGTDAYEFCPVTGTDTGASVTYVAPLTTTDDLFLTGGLPPNA